MSSCPRLVIAGANSGVGKTSFSIALTQALRNRGLRVQTFKVGPDFLDPSYLAQASGRPCYNLDGWIMGKHYVCRLFERATTNADIAIIEGVMGLYDGADPATSEGSTAQIAKWLNASIVLIVNSHGLGRSFAAVVKGLTEFEHDLKFAGIIANQCGSERHKNWLTVALKASASSSGGPELLGAIPRGGWPTLPSRHLGLITASSELLSASTLDRLSRVLEENVSLDMLVRRAKMASSAATSSTDYSHTILSLLPEIKIGVANDDAFHFYYQDIFDSLNDLGCKLNFFSPVLDNRLPEGLDALYIGGGYPEEHAAKLSANEKMRECIKRFCGTGRPVYAECGGLMYLSQSIQNISGTVYPMAQVLPARTRMTGRRVALGYAEVMLNKDSLFGCRGTTIRGHEFHYSELMEDPIESNVESNTKSSGWGHSYCVKRRMTPTETQAEGFQHGNILASYIHLHLASRPEAVAHFLGCCKE